jgi:hypothetical protein
VACTFADWRQLVALTERYRPTRGIARRFPRRGHGKRRGASHHRRTYDRLVRPWVRAVICNPGFHERDELVALPCRTCDESRVLPEDHLVTTKTAGTPAPLRSRRTLRRIRRAIIDDLPIPPYDNHRRARRVYLCCCNWGTQTKNNFKIDSGEGLESRCDTLSSPVAILSQQTRRPYASQVRPRSRTSRSHLFLSASDLIASVVLYAKHVKHSRVLARRARFQL